MLFRSQEQQEEAVDEAAALAWMTAQAAAITDGLVDMQTSDDGTLWAQNPQGDWFFWNGAEWIPYEEEQQAGDDLLGALDGGAASDSLGSFGAGSLNLQDDPDWDAFFEQQ